MSTTPPASAAAKAAQDPSLSPVEAALRRRILADPGFVLNDAEVMAALIGPTEQSDRQVVDLRGALIDRLETKLGALSESHRAVLAAAEDNMTGMGQVHRAVLAALDANRFEDFVAVVTEEFPRILDVDLVRLCVIAEDGAAPASPEGLQHIHARVMHGAAPYAGGHTVALRNDAEVDPSIFGVGGAGLQSVAFVRLDLGPAADPGLLAFGSIDPERFHPSQGAELLTFLGQVIERVMADWMSLVSAP